MFPMNVMQSLIPEQKSTQKISTLYICVTISSECISEWSFELPFFCGMLLQLPWTGPQGQGLPLSENSLEDSKKKEEKTTKKRREGGEKKPERGQVVHYHFHGYLSHVRFGGYH